MNCLVCTKELPPDWTAWAVHFECLNCIYCGQEVYRSEIEKLLKDGASSRGLVGSTEQSPLESSEQSTSIESHPIEVYHEYCKNKKLEEDFKNKPVVITQGHLDMLNSANLMFQANLTWSVETNQKDAEHQARKWMHEKSIEELFISMKRIEAIAAMYSIALSKEKNRIQIKLAELERINLKDLRNAEERVEVEKDRIKKREKEGLRLSPELRAQEKAISAMLLMGMSREQALESIEKAKAKRVQ
jgi:hypothetical protein